MKPYTLFQLIKRYNQVHRLYFKLQRGSLDLPEDEYNERQILIRRCLKRSLNISLIMRRIYKATAEYQPKQ